MRVFSLTFFFISFIALLIATYTDLKERIISDKLTYGLIGIGIILQAIYSIASNDLWILGIAVASTITTFSGAYLLWKIGFWAGGDVKLMTGLAALNPINYLVIGNYLGIGQGLFASNGYALPIFPLSLFIYSVMAMLPYGAWLSFTALAGKKSLKQRFAKETKEFIAIAGLLIIITLAYSLAFAGMQFFYSMLPVLVLIVLLYIALKLLMLKNLTLRKEVEFEKIEEGMIPAEKIVEEEGKIKRKQEEGIATIINYLRNNNLAGLMDRFRQKSSEKVLANPASAAGLTQKQAEELKKAFREKKISGKLKVKASVPFVPAIITAYIILQTTGDFIWNLIL
jgi:archaeal preflagellin peptidase FlaK